MKQPLSKKFNASQSESNWQQRWEALGIYHFDWNDKTRPTFSVDTPPPYPSGEFHMGNVLNWTYFDMAARYKRMRGFNVFFPQGWDCHGLGIEVEVERTHNVRKGDVPAETFRKWCEETVEKYIALMKQSIVRLGCSVDWSTEYRTMDPEYWKLTQLSYIMSYKKGFFYQGKHPVNWCPRCETAIADAEVDYEEREGSLHYIRFHLEQTEGNLTVATTRPELIPACVAVAVNPGDDRYLKYIGLRAKVPLTERAVETIADEMVDPSFGTGVVMICTYGDKADVKTVLKRKLPTISILTEKGEITKRGGKYAGLQVSEAKEATVNDLKASGLLERTEKTRQQVSVCDRCGTPVEILERRQWFMKTRMLTEDIISAAERVRWYPEYMKSRLTDWAQSLDWDWVISRQRIFGTPIPLWYCAKCKEIILAHEDWVPVDPKLEDPKIERCPKCDSTQFKPETDVFDTWMDSSITCAVHAGWPKRRDWERLFPADMHPSGIDIIRTWAYYLMARHLALFSKEPYHSCLINGMVLGADGRKMSKSLKNYIATGEVLEKHGADASRQWAAAGGTTGSDIPFRWSDVDYSWRFITKLWNAARFVSSQLKDFQLDENKALSCQPLDRWIISKAEKLTASVTDAFEKCQFNIVMEAIRNFTWHMFCDSYIEAVKDRLYRPETYGEDKTRAAQHTLYTVLYRILQLLAPVTPHVTEEIYQNMYADDKGYQSIHLSPWPQLDKNHVDEKAENQGDLIMTIIAEVRREKSRRRMPLNQEIRKLKIFAEEESTVRLIAEGQEDISGTCKITEIEILPEKGKGLEIGSYTNIHVSPEY